MVELPRCKYTGAKRKTHIKSCRKTGNRPTPRKAETGDTYPTEAGMPSSTIARDSRTIQDHPRSISATKQRRLVSFQETERERLSKGDIIIWFSGRRSPSLWKPQTHLADAPGRVRRPSTGRGATNHRETLLGTETLDKKLLLRAPEEMHKQSPGNVQTMRN